MARYTEPEFNASVDWDNPWSYRRPGAQLLRSSLADDVVVIASGNTCEHETCYETHRQVWIFGVGEQFFRKRATWNSCDGTQWDAGVEEVHPQKVIREEYQRL